MLQGASSAITPAAATAAAVGVRPQVALWQDSLPGPEQSCRVREQQQHQGLPAGVVLWGQSTQGSTLPAAADTAAGTAAAEGSPLSETPSLVQH